MTHKHKIKTILIIFAMAMLFLGANRDVIAAEQFQYHLLESFPGFFNGGDVMTDFPGMILAIYKFGIWTVGIAGMFMLVIGGFMYMASAGNTATAGNAKNIIADSLLGIAAALGAYLIMYVINPDLTKIDFSRLLSVGVKEATEGSPMGTAGSCTSLTTGDCSVANLTAVFSSAATQASSICNGESNGRNIPSSVDKCTGNNTVDSVSIGLFQINLSVHNVAGLPCPNAFNTKYTAKLAKDQSKCWVINRDLYNKCVTAAMNPTNNITVALNTYNAAGKSWKPWGANKRSNCNYR